MVEIMVASEAALSDAARQMIECGGNYNIWLFFGEMGVGKTAVIKKICETMEVEDQVVSPTFSIVNEYLKKDGQKIFHFDFYRIRSETEALDIGLEEYFDSGNLCLVEWPEKIKALWPEQYFKITIDVLGEQQRKISLIKHG